ncbi:Uncharacterised protein [Candidatus Gugararchaeum adminiculabundum]|nr:Uncharacterised protein [Candidatus Gugararchaeum adminiculabundum]
MCDFCSKVSSASDYLAKINSWMDRDIKRMAVTARKIDEGNRILADAVFSSIEWPLEIDFPLFETRTAYAVPTNYYQNLFVDGTRQRGDWAHDFTRAIAFVDGNLLLFSKSVASGGGEEWLSSYHLVHFTKNEFKATIKPASVMIQVDNVKKSGINMATKESASHTYKFTFVHNKTDHAFVRKESLKESGKMEEIYGRSSSGAPGAPGGELKIGMSDFEGYVLTVAHFAPHPYLLDEYKNLGYPSRMMFQNEAMNYLQNHLGSGSP